MKPQLPEDPVCTDPLHSSPEAASQTPSLSFAATMS